MENKLEGEAALLKKDKEISISDYNEVKKNYDSLNEKNSYLKSEVINSFIFNFKVANSK